jgi:hypothetical protein
MQCSHYRISPNVMRDFFKYGFLERRGWLIFGSLTINMKIIMKVPIVNLNII